MPYTVKPDGDVVCDTADEAVAIAMALRTQAAPAAAPPPSPARARRRRAFGSIKTDAPGWFSVVWHEGGRRRRKRGFDTREGAEAHLAKVRDQLAGSPPNASNASPVDASPSAPLCPRCGAPGHYREGCPHSAEEAARMRGAPPAQDPPPAAVAPPPPAPQIAAAAAPPLQEATIAPAGADSTPPPGTAQKRKLARLAAKHARPVPSSEPPKQEQPVPAGTHDGGIGSGRRGILRICAKCGGKGHSKRGCPADRQPAPDLPSAGESCVKLARAGDRFVVSEDFDEEDGTTWIADDVWEAIEPTGETVAGHQQWRLRRAGDGADGVGFPGLHPFVPHDARASGRPLHQVSIPKVGMGPYPTVAA